jgi:pantoate--beta-alanine ligase
MLEAQTIAEVRRTLGEWREKGARIGFVPTMGFLHAGHLALVDAARRLADRVVVSIFVNPLQFGPAEDLARYPRDLDRDRALLDERGTDLVYIPPVSEMYPEPARLRIDPGELGAQWEGAIRPGHFAGVLTVVAKLFHQVAPDLACFGQKDIQQATLIQRMVRELDWPIELVIVPTVRESDGLALSSRNVYLKPDERKEAVGLSEALAAAHQAFRAGQRSTSRIEAAMRERLAARPGIRVDYIAIVDPLELAPVTSVDEHTIVALAGRVGATRLIDNIRLGAGLAGAA